MKQHSNKDYCPVCWELWEECTCEDEFDEGDLIERDDQDIESGYNIY